MIGGATARVPAKINLHLGVGPLREDGFHELSTLYCALSLYDDVTVRAADALSVTVHGESRRLVPAVATNLAARAVVALAAHAGTDPRVADAALAVGARSRHAPAVHPEYHPDYYGAFVTDPDGTNLEAVCHLPAASD